MKNIDLSKTFILVTLLLCFIVFYGCASKQDNSEQIKQENEIVIVKESEIITPSPSPSPTPTPIPVFYPIEYSLLGIDMGMNPIEVEKKLGKPGVGNKTAFKIGRGKPITHGNDYGRVEFSLEIVDGEEIHKVSDIVITNPEVVGPREIMVGDDDVTVFEKLSIGEDLIESDSNLYYEGNLVGYVIYNDADKVDRIEIMIDEDENLLRIHFFEEKIDAYGIYQNYERSIFNTNFEKRNVYRPAYPVLAGVKLDMKYSEMVKIIGKPDKKIENYSEAQGDFTDYYYDFGDVRYYGNSDNANTITIGSIYVNQPGYELPRGIELGDTLEQVYQKLGFDEEKIPNPINEHFWYYYEENRNVDFNLNEANEFYNIEFSWDVISLDINFENGLVTSVSVGYWDS